ncbi:MAG: MMPL family transporter, partial [Bacteroidales bacterium]|nr:MMPL family transporter [Bacteroidales bacterium]
DDYDDIRGRITEAMDWFGELWEETDTASVIPDMQVAEDDASILEVADFIRRNAPYLMTEGDYRRIDSLLALPGYIPDMMKKNRRMLMFPASSIVSENLRNDPLDFFSPLYIRLMSLNVSSSGEMFDSHIFLDGCKTGAVFFESPFGKSESVSNSHIAEMLDKVIGETEAEFGDVRISAAGGPLIAVANARQIKKDSILAVVIAIVLISLVLFLSFREFGDIIWIVASIVCGSVFSLGLIAAFKSSVSVIVLGIGSVIIGIAVNYPLHYIDHLKHEPDTKKALKDIVNPLLAGNITTVCAFLSLFLLRAEALHDFGLTGAIMLVGTILFVLIFLPALMKSGKKRSRKTVSFDFSPHISARMQKRLAIPFVVATAVLACFSSRTSFDLDMRNINYMTPSQREDLALLSSAGNLGSVIYAVC